MSLLRELRDFVPPHPRTGEPGGLVLNLADGIQGIARPAHVPAMLELAGVAYTGPTPWGHVLAVDQVVSKDLLRQAGVPVPGVAAIEDGVPPALAFPLVVKPRHEASYPLIVVGDRRELGRAVAKVARRFRQPVVVEEFVGGRRVSVGVLGNEPPECLPLVEVDDATGKRKCPAAIDEALASRLRRYAVIAFRTCGCRDIARIDFRVPEGGDARLIEVSSVGILGRSSVVAVAARRAGLEFDALVCRVVEVARSRYVRAASPDRPAPRRGRSAAG
jgi:D-alanine-D-alanine ligase